MAKKKLKRSLFIGLGGTGLKSIVHTKKRFIDTYGEVPPMVAFLALDTDDDGINFKIDNHLGTDKIGLEKSEFLHTKVKDPQAILNQQAEYFDFVPEKNKRLLTSLVKGAGQVRSNGRFAVHFNYSSIETAINSKLTSILDADSISNEKFETNGDDVEINMMFSVAGGTGSGTFIDIAYIVKEASKSINATVGVSTIGFAILPDVFNSMMNGPAMANVLPNGFGAMSDLDYLMHQDLTKNPLEIKYFNKTITINRPPFDLVFTINNKDKRGNTYTKIDDLSELIGLAMFTGASELSGSMASSYDNVRAVIAGGALKVENKDSWACGLGLSELFYDGNKLGNIFARKAEALIINNLITAESDAFNLADIFIDKAKIRENNGDENNELIDALLNETPNIPYSYIQDVKSPEGETYSYLSNIEESAKGEIEGNYNYKKEEVDSILKQFIVENINKESGVGNIASFLDGLQNQVKDFLGEMKFEKEEISNNDKLFRNQQDQAIDELKNLGVFDRKFGSRLQDSKDEVIQAVNMVARNIHEQLRRDNAITFFNELLSDIANYKSEIKDIVFKLKNVSKTALSNYSALQNQIDEEPKKFVKELHRDFVNSIVVAEEDYSVSDFIKFIKEKDDNGIFDFSQVSEKIIDNSLWKYTKELSKSLEYRNMSIDEVLSKYSPDKLESLVKELIEKSNPLWSYDYKGFIINPEHHEAFIIGVPNLKDSVLVKNKVLDNILEANQKVSFNSTSMNDRIVVYRMEATAPIYAVSNMGLYEEKNNRSNINHHIDANWLLRMDRENFSIYPAKKEDHSLEYWVLGFIYGYIKYEEGQYMAYSLEQGDALEDYWLELGEYRDDAFEAFKKLKLHDEFKELIEKKISKMGEVENQKLLDDVVAESNYRDSYSNRDFEIKDLRDSKMIKVKELFTNEINLVKKVLA